MTPNELVEKQNWRYACKKFDSLKKIDDQTWNAIEDSLILTASSYGAMPFKFIVVKDQALKDELMQASFKQAQVSECSHHVVFLAKEKIDEAHIQKYVEQISKVRGVSLESLDGFKGMMIKNLVDGQSADVALKWATNQVYIALGNLLTSAALLGVDTCAMEGISKKKYNEILKLEGTGYTVVCACPCGYRSEEDKYKDILKVRFDKAELIQTL